MKIICPRKTLLQGVQTAGRAVSSRSSLAILSHILIRAQDNKITLAATDLEIGVECSVAAEVIEKGSLTLPSKVITEVLASLTDEIVTISVDGENKVSITSGSSDYQILGMAPEEFPMLPEVKDEASFSIQKSVLRDAIEKSAFAVSPDESRASLTGILVSLEEGELSLVSTDTHRLCLVNCEVETWEGEISAIIPGRAMSEMHRIIQDEEGVVKITVSQNQALFTVDDVSLVSRLIEGQFPNYQKVIPQEYAKRLIVPTEQLLQSVKRASIVARDNSNRVVLSTEDNVLKVTAESTSVGTAREELDVVLEGEDIEIAFSAKYLMDFLVALGSAESIEMQLTSNVGPSVLRPHNDEDYTYVLMPMQIR